MQFIPHTDGSWTAEKPLEVVPYCYYSCGLIMRDGAGVYRFYPDMGVRFTARNLLEVLKKMKELNA